MTLPDDGDYYIYNVGYKRFWDSGSGSHPAGDPIIGSPLKQGPSQQVRVSDIECNRDNIIQNICRFLVDFEMR